MVTFQCDLNLRVLSEDSGFEPREMTLRLANMGVHIVELELNEFTELRREETVEDGAQFLCGLSHVPFGLKPHSNNWLPVLSTTPLIHATFLYSVRDLDVDLRWTKAVCTFQ
jgi:hypothetical protein